jgi:succinate dehydrogenase/fumarate reductase flavoprotein subunit
LAYEKYETDVLVIGSGGAGLRAAASAVENEVNVILVTKGKVGSTGSTIMAGEDVCADVEVDGKSVCDLGLDGDPDDSNERWFHEIVVQGFYLNEQNLVWTYVENAPKIGKELVDSNVVEGMEPGSTRALRTTGRGIIKSLRRRIHDVELVEDTAIVDLLTCNGRIAGAVGFNVNDGNLCIFKAKAIIIATGGFHCIYPVFCGSRACTGDGQSMAYRVGAKLVDMEMITTPPVVVWPLKYRGNALPIIANALMGGKGDFLDKNGRNILERYDPKVLEVVSKTEWDKLFLCRAIKKAIEEGVAGPHGGVFFSMKNVPLTVFEEAEKQFPGLKKKGDLEEMVSILKKGDSLEVAPYPEYCEGGIKINEKCETNIPGLFAAGECTGGLWGSNRVSAATTEMLVHGLIAGKSAAEYSKAIKDAPKVDEKQIGIIEEKVFRPLRRNDGTGPIDLRKRLQRVVDEALSPIREGIILEKAIRMVEKMKREELPRLCVSSTKSRFYNSEWMEAVQIENLLTVVEASLKSASARKESRGVHYRSDCPKTDNDNWLKHIVIFRESDNVRVVKEPVTITKIPLPKGTEDYEELIMDTIKTMEKYEKFW